jgi:ABC-type branched-subunit amino acid transport system permease subunit
MALVEQRKPATLQPLWIERVPPAWWAVILILLTMPAWANNFILFQVMGWTFILGIIALSLMFLAGYGGMVSLIQMSVAAMAGYMVAIFGTLRHDRHQPGTALVGLHPGGDRRGRDLRDDGRRSRRQDRGHLHHHDHAGDRVGLLLLRAPELRDLQRLFRLQPRRPAAALRRGLAPACSVLLPCSRLRGALLRGGRLRLARAVRAGACRGSGTTRAGWLRWGST